MEKERRVKTLSLVALIVAVLGLTVAFASLSQTLTITGTASVNAASWDVHFESLVKGETTGGASVSGEPILSETTISGLNLAVTKPNDYIEYTFDIVNSGTIDAKVEDINLTVDGEQREIKTSTAGEYYVELCSLTSSVESCDWDNSGSVDQNDVDNVNNNIALFFIPTSGGTFAINDVLAKNNGVDDTKLNMTIGLYYYNIKDDLEAVDVPTRNLKFNNISLSIIYKQS